MSKTRGGMVGVWGRAGVRCKAKAGKREGEALCYFDVDGKLWTVVVWDDEKTPVVREASRLLVKECGDRKWRRVAD